MESLYHVAVRRTGPPKIDKVDVIRSLAGVNSFDGLIVHHEQTLR